MNEEMPKYVPNSEEVKKVEDMMSYPQLEMSANREKKLREIANFDQEAENREYSQKETVEKMREWLTPLVGTGTYVYIYG